jgi:hypothetical protein
MAFPLLILLYRHNKNVDFSLQSKHYNEILEQRQQQNQELRRFMAEKESAPCSKL